MPVVSAHRKEPFLIVEGVFEYIPSGNGTEGKSAECPVVTGGEYSFLVIRLCESRIFALYRRNEFIYVLIVEHGNLFSGFPPVFGLIVLVPCRRYCNERGTVSILDHIVEKILHLRSAFHAEVSLRIPCPSVYKIYDVVFL